MSRPFSRPFSRIATKALNIVLLIAIPFGTALGIYGLLKVDKEAAPSGA